MSDKPADKATSETEKAEAPDSAAPKEAKAETVKAEVSKASDEKAAEEKKPEAEKSAATTEKTEAAPADAKAAEEKKPEAEKTPADTKAAEAKSEKPAEKGEAAAKAPAAKSDAEAKPAAKKAPVKKKPKKKKAPKAPPRPLINQERWFEIPIRGLNTEADEGVLQGRVAVLKHLKDVYVELTDEAAKGFVTEIDTALERIYNGSYHTCTRCNRSIPINDIWRQNYPWMTTCRTKDKDNYCNA